MNEELVELCRLLAAVYNIQCHYDLANQEISDIDRYVAISDIEERILMMIDAQPFEAALEKLKNVPNG